MQHSDLAGGGIFPVPFLKFLGPAKKRWAVDSLGVLTGVCFYNMRKLLRKEVACLHVETLREMVRQAIRCCDRQRTPYGVYNPKAFLGMFVC